MYHCIFFITATFNGLGSLKKLSLSSQKLTELREGMFLALTSLESLNLGWNSIEHVGPNSFKGMPKLKDLQLFRNKLISLSVDSFRGLLNLEGLNVGGMCILTIESGFLQNVPKLHSLHVTPRNLSVLQKYAFTGHSTGLKIYLSRYWQCSDNYWKCSLDECWMVREIQEGITGTGIVALLLIITCIVIYKCGKCTGNRKAKSKQKGKSEENEMVISSRAGMENRQISSRYMKTPNDEIGNQACVTPASRYLHPPTESEKHNYLDLL